MSASSAVRVFDNQGETVDRYTVVYTEHVGRNGRADARGMCDRPTHPQGFGQFTEVSLDWVTCTDKDDIEIAIDDLPQACRDMVTADLDSYRH